MKKLVFIGCDGAGKSTLVKFVKNQLDKEEIKSEIIFMGWRNFKNPFLKLFVKFRKVEKIRLKNDEILKRYRGRSWAFYIIYFLEMWTRYFQVIFSKKEIILFDRYFFDEILFADKIKFNFFSRITPKPDVCFILRSSIDTMKKRGYEYSKKSLDEFYEHLNMTKRFSKVVNLNTSKKPRLLYKEIQKFL